MKSCLLPSSEHNALKIIITVSYSLVWKQVCIGQNVGFWNEVTTIIQHRDQWHDYRDFVKCIFLENHYLNFFAVSLFSFPCTQRMSCWATPFPKYHSGPCDEHGCVSLVWPCSLPQRGRQDTEASGVSGPRRLLPRCWTQLRRLFRGSQSNLQGGLKSQFSGRFLMFSLTLKDKFSF